jgi:hypothetical protein
MRPRLTFGQVALGGAVSPSTCRRLARDCLVGHEPPIPSSGLETANPVPEPVLVLPGFEKVRTGGLEDLLEESGERAGFTGARYDRAVAPFQALRQGEPPPPRPLRERFAKRLA